MSTEAVLIVVAAAVVLITILTYLAGRAENGRSMMSPAQPPLRAGPESESRRSLRSERDVVLGDDDARDAGGRFERTAGADRSATRPRSFQHRH